MPSYYKMKTRKNKLMVKKINGYNVLFVNIPTHTIHIEVIVKSGFIHETMKTAGINHLLEHVLVSGWKKCNGSCNTFWDKRGAIVNASTDDAVMKYYIKGLATEMDEMIEYISTIVTHPLITQSTIDNEKQAVIDEITALSANPKSEMYNVFYKAFYKPEGLKCLEDYGLQLKNIKNLSVDDIKKVYEKTFNHENMFVVICGHYDRQHVSKLLTKYLLPTKGTNFNKMDCFTHQHKIIHSPFKAEGTNILIGFPSTLMGSEFFDCFTVLLHQLLFKEMRTIHKLLYDIMITTKTTECGTLLIIEISVRDANVKETMRLLLRLLNDYCHSNVDSELVEACKKTVKYKYYMTISNVDYYVKCIMQKTPLLTKEQSIKQVGLFTSEKFKRMCTQLFVFEEALCVYQSKRDAHLSWPMFAINS